MWVFGWVIAMLLGGFRRGKIEGHDVDICGGSTSNTCTIKLCVAVIAHPNTEAMVEVKNAVHEALLESELILKDRLDMTTYRHQPGKSDNTELLGVCIELKCNGHSCTGALAAL